MKTLFSLVIIHDQMKPFNTQCCRIENNRNAEISSTTLPPLPQVIHSPYVHRKGHWSSICEGRRGLLHSPCALPPLYVNNFTTVIGACCWMTVVGCWMWVGLVERRIRMICFYLSLSSSFAFLLSYCLLSLQSYLLLAFLFLLLSYCCLIAALLLSYCCFTAVLLLSYCCLLLLCLCFLFVVIALFTTVVLLSLLSWSFLVI